MHTQLHATHETFLPDSFPLTRNWEHRLTTVLRECDPSAEMEFITSLNICKTTSRLLHNSFYLCHRGKASRFGPCKKRRTRLNFHTDFDDFASSILVETKWKNLEMQREKWVWDEAKNVSKFKYFRNMKKFLKRREVEISRWSPEMTVDVW